MILLITELILGDVNTISIPTDAIFTISLLMIFGLLGYIFNRILSSDTNQFTQKIDDGSTLELSKETLEDQLALESTKVDQENIEKPNIRKINFISTSTVLRRGGLAFLALGGASLIGLQHMQKSYKGVSVSQDNIQLDTESTQSQLSAVKLKPIAKTRTKIKIISYINPFLSTIKRSTNKNAYKVNGAENENNFSF